MRTNDEKRQSNGFDSLNVYLTILFVLLCIFGRLTPSAPAFFFAAVVLAIVIFRTRSKNLAKRQAENYRFIHHTGGVRDGYERWRFKNSHCCFKCENCGAKVAANPDLGDVTLVCPNCGHSFTAHT